MAYATHTDVEKLIRATLANDDGEEFSASTVVTDDDADAIIVEVQGEVDSLLASVDVTVPVTEPAHFLTSMKALVLHGAAARILRSWFPDARGAGEQPAFAYWQKLYDAGMKNIKDMSGIPSDAVFTSGRVAAETYLSRNPETNLNLGANAEPSFYGGLKG